MAEREGFAPSVRVNDQPPNGRGGFAGTPGNPLPRLLYGDEIKCCAPGIARKFAAPPLFCTMAQRFFAPQNRGRGCWYVTVEAVVASVGPESHQQWVPLLFAGGSNRKRDRRMSRVTDDIVGKLWNLCNILKDDGVVFHQYVVELTYLLFLKMAEETGHEDKLPPGYRWEDLVAEPTPNRMAEAYQNLLEHLDADGSMLVKQIFHKATSSISKATTLSTLVKRIDQLDWYSARQEGLGDLYEGLLQKNTLESKSGAGQYFTPRPLIDSMVAVMKPTLDDVIQDPAAGTGGFLIAANHYIRGKKDPVGWTNAQKNKHRLKTFYGMEHVKDTHRLALMNLMLHGIDSDPDSGGIHKGDTLSPDNEKLPPATLILTNPPFGTKKGGGLPERKDFRHPTGNKQFCFLQHIYHGLKRGGRAAVVLPDNVLFESIVGTEIRQELMDKCDLHTILR